MEGNSSPRNYSWAAFLILVGIMFLLNTTGVVSWSIWMYVLRFWPILIVLIGVRIILGNSLFARVFGMLLTIILTVCAFGIAYIQSTGVRVSFLPDKVNDWVQKGGSGIFNLTGDMVEESNIYSFDEYTNIDERYFNIDVGACEFGVSEGDFDGQVKIDSVFPKSYKSPELEDSFKDGKLDLEFKGALAKQAILFYDESKYDIFLQEYTIPTSFDVKLGAGKGSMSFDEQIVKDFGADVGAGKLDVNFSKDSLPNGEMRFTVGAGQISVSLPDTVGYELTYDLGVGSIKTDGEDISGIAGGRGKYTSSNFSSADKKVSIYVSVGVGEFNIESN